MGSLVIGSIVTIATSVGLSVFYAHRAKKAKEVANTEVLEIKRKYSARSSLISLMVMFNVSSMMHLIDLFSIFDLSFYEFVLRSSS